jgi:hypothetical protein
MNKHALCFGVCAGLLLAAGTASAGTCSAEIEALQKTIANTGSVASAGASQGTSIQQGTNATITADSASATPAPAPDVNGTDASGGMMASTAPSGAGAGTGTAPGKIEQPDASGGTLADQGAGGQPAQTAPLDSETPNAAPPGTAANPIDPDAASQSLARAKVLDQAGDEAGCMQQVNQAKSQLGQQ